jgi:selenocysteine lyase/cysteine desulfurase
VTPAELRALVPAALRIAYLNAAAASPLPRPVGDAVRAHIEGTMERGDVDFPRWLAERDALRARVARLIGASARDVAFLSSTSIGFSVVASILKARGVREIVTLEHEFPSTAIPFLNAGIELRAVRPREDGSYRAEDIEGACTSSTGAIAVSIVQFASGFRVDLDAVRSIARDRKIALCLNAAQAIGHVPIDVAGADFVCGACHKWLMAGYGAAIFVAKPEWLDPLPLAGWLSVDESVRWQTFGGAATEVGDRVVVARGAKIVHEAPSLEAGGGIWALYPGIAAAIDLQEKMGPKVILEHDLGLQRRLRDGLRARGFTANAPDDPARSSGITVVPVANPLGVVRGLRDKGVLTTPRGPGVRISTHVYNDESDVERLLAAWDALGVSQP